VALVAASAAIRRVLYSLYHSSYAEKGYNYRLHHPEYDSWPKGSAPARPRGRRKTLRLQEIITATTAASCPSEIWRSPSTSGVQGGHGHQPERIGIRTSGPSEYQPLGAQKD